MALAAAAEPSTSSNISIIEISDVEDPTPVANETPAVVQPLATAVSAAEQSQDQTTDAVSGVTSAAKDLSVSSPDVNATKLEASIEKENEAISIESSPADADATETARAAKPESEGTESEESIPAPRVTRNRASLVRVQESDTESESAPRQRTRRQRSQSTGGTKTTTTTPSKTGKKTKKKGGRKSGRRGRKPAATDNDDDDDSDDGTPGEYVPVEVGDCVLLDSGDPDDHFVALVSSVQRSQNFVKQPGTFTAQWYYKPDDVRAEVRALIPGGVLAHEVFLSPHKDKNSIDAVIGLCHVVSPDEYAEVESEVKRGFRDATTKPYYICRYKYYPGRPVKKALEAVKNDAIRSGLGPMKPKVGDAFQATVPEFTAPPPPPAPVAKANASNDAAVLPWKRTETSAHQYEQVWSPLAAEHQSLGLHAFLLLLKPLRFSIGNVVTLFRRQDALVPASGHVRAIVLAYDPSDHVRICLSTGDVLSVLPSELCSPLTDDVALTSWYRARFSLSAAIAACTAALARAQSIERDAFRMEVVTFSQLTAPVKQTLELSTDDDDDDEDEDDASESESDASPLLPEDDDGIDDDSHANKTKRVRSMRKRRK